MKVVVTQEHIDNAYRQDSHHCMVADAIRDLGLQYPIVDAQAIRFSNMATGLRTWYLTEPKVQAALTAWDDGKAIKPFSFNINLKRPAKVRKVRNRWVGSPKVLKKARSTYEKSGHRKRKTFTPVSRFRRNGFRSY